MTLPTTAAGPAPAPSPTAGLDEAIRSWLASSPPDEDVITLAGELQELAELATRAALRRTSRNGKTQLANGWLVNRTGGTLGSFKEWDNDRLKPLVVHHVAARIGVNSAGDIDEALEQAAEQAAAMMLDLVGSWREKGLRGLGLDPERFARRDMSPLRLTVTRSAGPAL